MLRHELAVLRRIIPRSTLSWVGHAVLSAFNKLLPIHLRRVARGLVNPAQGACQQPAVCFHAIPSNGHRGLPNHESTTVAWHCPADIPRLTMHPTVRKRLTEAMTRPAPTTAPSPHDQNPLTNELLRQ